MTSKKYDSGDIPACMYQSWKGFDAFLNGHSPEKHFDRLDTIEFIDAFIRERMDGAEFYGCGCRGDAVYMHGDYALDSFKFSRALYEAMKAKGLLR